MKQFEYHSAAAAGTAPAPTNWLRWVFYLGALLLLVAGVHSIYLYFTAWSAADEIGHWWDLVLGLLYLLFGFLIAYATYVYQLRRRVTEVSPDRYAIIEDGRLIYDLDQVNGRQEIPLAGMTAVDRPSVRELRLTLTDGSLHSLPIFLIEEEEHQRELERVLRAHI